MDLSNLFLAHWQKTFAQWNTGNCHLLLAVSGGVDSVVLTDLVHQAGFDFSIAHCNFQLRGADSERDEQFVTGLGDKYDKPVFVKKFETAVYADARKMAIQEAARKLRYDWFAALLNDLGNSEIAAAKKILLVTAHHADDNIETVLMQFFRGTGIQGMRGILPIQEDRSLIRPLLAFRKEWLMQYAAANGLNYVEDISNASDKYTRNFFRNQLIPQIKTVFPRAEENILQNIERMREVAVIYQEAVDQQLKKIMERKGAEWHVPILKLKQVHTLNTIIWEMIKPFNFLASQVNEFIKLMDADNGACISSASHRIIKNRKWLIIAANEPISAAHIVIEKNDQQILFQNGALHFQLRDNNVPVIGSDAHQACLNADLVQYPLLLRKWKTGDYFYPLGMQKKKKLSRFFIDQKLSKTAKENVWVIESNKKIVWVIGLRIDDRFKITPATNNSLLIKFTAA